VSIAGILRIMKDFRLQIAQLSNSPPPRIQPLYFPSSSYLLLACSLSTRKRLPSHAFFNHGIPFLNPSTMTVSPQNSHPLSCERQVSPLFLRFPSPLQKQAPPRNPWSPRSPFMPRSTKKGCKWPPPTPIFTTPVFFFFFLDERLNGRGFPLRLCPFSPADTLRPLLSVRTLLLVQQPIIGAPPLWGAFFFFLQIAGDGGKVWGAFRCF